MDTLVSANSTLNGTVIPFSGIVSVKRSALNLLQVKGSLGEQVLCGYYVPLGGNKGLGSKGVRQWGSCREKPLTFSMRKRG